MLAIGFNGETDFTWSIQTESRDAQEVCNQLMDHTEIIPDQILLIEDEGVIEHWNFLKQYIDLS